MDYQYWDLDLNWPQLTTVSDQNQAKYRNQKSQNNYFYEVVNSFKLKEYNFHCKKLFL